MPNPLLTRRRIMALKAESVMGTAVSLAAADAGLKVEDRDIRIVSAAGARQRQGTGGSDVRIREESYTDVTLTSRVHGKGAVGLPVWALRLLPACGFVVTSQVYARTWDPANWVSLSAGDFVNGVKKLARGLLGNAVFNMVPGKMGTVDATLMGAAVADPADATLLTGVTYETVDPPIWVPGAGSALTIDGQTIFKPSRLQLDLGNVVSRREDPNSYGGYCSGWIGEGAAKFTLNPEAYTRATFDFFAKFSANDTFAISCVYDGGTNNTITFAATVQVTQAPDWEDDQGKVRESLVLEEVDDSLTITFA